MLRHLPRAHHLLAAPLEGLCKRAQVLPARLGFGAFGGVALGAAHRALAQVLEAVWRREAAVDHAPLVLDLVGQTR